MDRRARIRDMLSTTVNRFIDMNRACVYGVEETQGGFSFYFSYRGKKYRIKALKLPTSYYAPYLLVFDEKEGIGHESIVRVVGAITAQALERLLVGKKLSARDKECDSHSMKLIDILKLMVEDLAAIQDTKE